jgi:hypothetical protein
MPTAKSPILDQHEELCDDSVENINTRPEVFNSGFTRERRVGVDSTAVTSWSKGSTRVQLRTLGVPNTACLRQMRWKGHLAIVRSCEKAPGGAGASKGRGSDSWTQGYEVFQTEILERFA